MRLGIFFSRSRNKIDETEAANQEPPQIAEPDDNETDYPMSAHITDIDDLLGRDKRVIWPPPEPETETYVTDIPDSTFSPSPPPPPSPVPPPAPAPQVRTILF